VRLDLAFRALSPNVHAVPMVARAIRMVSADMGNLLILDPRQATSTCNF